MNEKYIIIVTGDLAAGKTTYGKKISEELNIPFFSKDKFKEIMFDAIDNNSFEYEEKRKIGTISYAVLYNVAEELMKVGNTFILESNFVEQSIPILNELISKYNYKVITIRFIGDLNVLHQRFLKREYSEERHAGVNANGAFDNFKDFKIATEKTRKFKIVDQEIIVDTTDFSNVNFEKIMYQIYSKIK